MGAVGDIAAASQVNSKTWRRLRIYAESRWLDGTLDDIHIETLQPPEWLAAHEVQVGATVPLPLDLLEMGLPNSLTGTVIANDPCPTIVPGPGQVVLTTVNHLNADIQELTCRNAVGQEEIVRPTSLHKFYRESDDTWVSVRDLTPGDRLRGKHGSAVVIGNRPISGVQRVYNITVEGEHVYHVSALALLVHNNNCAAAQRPATRFITDVTVRDRRTGRVLRGTVDLGPTLDRIRRGGAHPHGNDGSVFGNREGLLPARPQGYYREYVHPTPGFSGPGPQRIIRGSGGELYYTPDHYGSFVPLN